MTISDDKALLAALKQGALTAPKIYQPGPYWQPYQDRMFSELDRETVSDFRRNSLIAKGFSDNIRPLPIDWDGSWKSRLLAKAMCLPGLSAIRDRDSQVVTAMHKRAFRFEGMYRIERDKALLEQAIARYGGFPNSVEGGCEALAPGTDLGLDGDIAVHYLRLIERLYKFDPEDALQPNTYFEIGGGFGAMLHLMLEWRPSIKKAILLDIPPVIYVATQYLKRHYGAAVRDYRDTMGIERITFRDDDELEIICIPTWQIESLDVSIDLFHNAASFSEMTAEIVSNYAAHIERFSGPETAIWLVLNKPRGHWSVETAVPDSIGSAFAWADLEPLPGDDLYLWRPSAR